MSTTKFGDQHYLSKVTNTHAALIREDIPFGPVHLPQIESIAGQHGVHPDYVLKIARGLTHQNARAFPTGHPIIPTLPPKPRAKPGAKYRLSWQSKEIILLQQEYRCVYCYSHISVETSTTDHIVARSQGGSHHITNLQLTCWECNHSKGHMPDQEWRQLLNRKQKLRHLMTSPGYRKAHPHPFKGMKRCTCSIHGCHPGCTGCQLCGHTPKKHPTRIVCPAGTNPPSPCGSPSTCKQTRLCRLQKIRQNGATH